jgi:KaiC/GvpD/RAD55 family RecA-like ATPase
MFPDNFAVLVVGNPSAGMFEFCAYLGAAYLSAGERLVFCESNVSAELVRKQLELFGIDAAECESNGQLAIADFSKGLNVKDADPKAIMVQDVSNLEEVIERVEEAVVKVGGHPVRVMFDSLTPLYMQHDSNEVGKFFSALTSMVKVSGKMTATIHSGIVPDEQVALLATIADGVLEIKIDEQFHRFVRIKHFRGLRVAPNWVPFDFQEEEDGEGVFFSWRRD